jgi:hypothetical protein
MGFPMYHILENKRVDVRDRIETKVCVYVCVCVPYGVTPPSLDEHSHLTFTCLCQWAFKT